jgi:hypothetical protein
MRAQREKPKQDRIDRTLKAIYREIVQQPVPERLAKLLVRMSYIGRKVLH